MHDIEEPFLPDWVLPPGGTIRDAAEERGWQNEELAQRPGLPLQDLLPVLEGQAPITPELANRLAEGIGSTPGFWLRLQSNYEAHVARLHANEETVDDSLDIDGP